MAAVTPNIAPKANQAKRSEMPLLSSGSMALFYASGDKGFASAILLSGIIGSDFERPVARESAPRTERVRHRLAATVPDSRASTLATVIL
jgi:hypothetical protein